jgi:hypothetical protein
MIGIIYEIVCKNPEIIDRYIGSSIQYYKRIEQHIRDLPLKQHLPLYSCISKNGGIDNWSFNILDEYKCNTRQELYQRERLYYEIYEPTLNIFRPYSTSSLDSKYLCDEKYPEKRRKARLERYYKNPEKPRSYARDYYQKNKEKILAYDKANRDKKNELRREATARRKQERELMGMEDVDAGK